MKDTSELSVTGTECIAYDSHQAGQTSRADSAPLCKMNMLSVLVAANNGKLPLHKSLGARAPAQPSAPRLHRIQNSVCWRMNERTIFPVASEAPRRVYLLKRCDRRRADPVRRVGQSAMSVGRLNRCSDLTANPNLHRPLRPQLSLMPGSLTHINSVTTSSEAAMTWSSYPSSDSTTINGMGRSDKGFLFLV